MVTGDKLVDDIIGDVFKKPLRCEKCFITHFPWAKVCKKNFNEGGWLLFKLVRPILEAVSQSKYKAHTVSL